MRALVSIVILASCHPLDAALGLGHANFAFSQSTYDFGAVPANHAHAIAAIGLTNVGDAPGSVDAVTTGPFTITANDCSQVPPGTGCMISLDVVDSSLGPISDTITITGGATAALTATIEGWVHPTASAGGTVSVSPPTSACGGSCYYPEGLVVTVIATPAPGNHFVGWSDPACTGTRCEHTVDAIPYEPVATFAPGTTTVPFQVTIDGGGLGGVRISQPNYGIVGTCHASCTVGVSSDDGITVDAATPDDFVTFSGPCPSGPDECLLPAGTPSVAATFHAAPGEQDVFPLTDAGPIYSVDFTADGKLVLGTADGVIELDAAFTPHVISSLVGVARVATDGGIFVVTPTELDKLTATGGLQWSRPGGFPLPMPVVTGSSGHPFATLPGGGIAIGFPSFTILDASGAVVATPPLVGTATCMTAGGDGSIYVGTSPDSFLDLEVHAFDALGGAQSDFMIFGSNSLACAIGVGTQQLAVTQASEFQDEVFVQRLRLDRTFLGDTHEDFNGNSVDDRAMLQVAVDTSDNTFWVHSDPLDYPFTGLDLVKIDAAGTMVFAIRRPTFLPSSGFAIPTGLEIYDLAIAPDGRVAVAGVFHDSDGARAIVEIVPP